MDFNLIFNSILLGVGLAMDAFSVSLADGLNEPCMRRRKMSAVAGTFAFFQALMPLAGWLCVHTVLQYFKVFELAIPYIALVLLAYIGGKMLYEGITNPCTEGCCLNKTITISALVVQGIATSIDALSVGFTIAHYDLVSAIVCALIIAGCTFPICYAGLYIGKKAGTKLAGKAGILGGSILIFIGIEIFVSNVFF